MSGATPDGSVLTNSALASTTDAPTVSQTEQTTVAGPAPAHPQLAVIKQNGVDPVASGGALTYPVTVTNIGTMSISSVVLTNAYPTDLVFGPSFPSPDSGKNDQSRSVPLGPGASTMVSCEHHFHSQSAGVIGSLPWPEDAGLGDQFRNRFVQNLVVFAADLWTEAETIARQKRHAVIRVDDVNGYAHRFIPHQINEYEDALFFPRLDIDDRVAIESYDMDAFRDSGTHWRYLPFALEWPNGEVDVFEDVAANHRYHVDQVRQPDQIIPR